MKKKFRCIYDKFVLNKVRGITSFLAFGVPAMAQAQAGSDTGNWVTSPGIIGTFILVVIIVLVAVLVLSVRLSAYMNTLKRRSRAGRKLEFSEELIGLDEAEIDAILEKRKAALAYKLSGNELGSGETALDHKGMIAKVTHDPDNPLVDEKKKTRLNLETPEPLKKIVIWYLGASVFWLVFGTLIGQYVGMKFVWPEMDTVSWLSFGRLRPVHTNTVFWGWASLAMIGLGYFVVARTSNTIIYSYKWAWRAWRLINLSVIAGNIFLMSGINNGGGARPGVPRWVDRGRGPEGLAEPATLGMRGEVELLGQRRS